MTIFLRFLFVLFSFATASAVLCPRCVEKGTISYFSEDSALSSGSCAYGSMALDFNDGYVAAAGSSFYNDGAGCGGCYKMRCKDQALCRSQGTTVIVTDQITNSNNTDFVLSRKAYMALAKKGMEKQLLKHRAVDVEYKRYPCDFFNNKNLSLRVEESSRYPDYLAVKVLYQGGQTKILHIIISPESSFSGIWLERNHSAVWAVQLDSPFGQSWINFAVIKGTETWYISTPNDFPTDWKPGMIFDTGLQINEFRLEACSVPRCPKENW